MFPREIWFKPYWCLYDTMEGDTILTYPYRKGLSIPCPHCSKALLIERYSGECCGKKFRVSFNRLSQSEPVGHHSRVHGRGWESLRPYEP